MTGKGVIVVLVLLMLVHYVIPQGEPFSVHLESNKTVTNVGEHVGFTCTVTSNEPFSLHTSIYRNRTDSANPIEVDKVYVMSKQDNQAQFYCNAKKRGDPEINKISNTITTTVKFKATQITMTEKPTNSVKIGEHLALRCKSSSSYPASTIEWRKHRPEWPTPKQIFRPIYSNQQPGDFGIMQESNYNFLVSKDDGNATYECGIKGTDVRSSVKLNVTCAAPSWHEINSTSHESSGQYGGQMVTSSVGIKATKEVNNRKYKCISLYQSGNDSIVQFSNATLKVKWKASEVKMTEKPREPINVGDTVKIECETTSTLSVPPGEFVWIRNGQLVPPRVKIFRSSPHRNSNGFYRYISAIELVAEKADNQATFACKIKDEEPFMNETKLQVFFPPVGIMLNGPSITSREGEQKTFVCETTSSSNPPAMMSVKKGDEVLPLTPKVTGGDNGGYDVMVEVLVDTKRSDNGVWYHCIAIYLNNTMFTKSAYNNVTFNTTNVSITEEPTQALHSGMTIIITCETDSANPAAEIQFQRKRKTLQIWETIDSKTIDSSLTLTVVDRIGAYNGKIRTIQMRIRATRHDEETEFRCQVRDQSHRSDVTQVKVFYPPMLRMKHSGSIRLNEGDKLILTCDAFGGNPDNYNYTWYRNDIQISSATGRSYTIDKLSYTQNGTYKCRAINYSPGGIVSDTVNIEVQYKPQWNPQFAEVRTFLNLNELVTVVLPVIANPSPVSVKLSSPTREKSIMTKISPYAVTYMYTLKCSDCVENCTATVMNEIGETNFVFTVKELREWVLINGKGEGHQNVHLHGGASFKTDAPFQSALHLKDKSYAQVNRVEIWDVDFTMHMYIKCTGKDKQARTIIGSWVPDKWLFLLYITANNELQLHLRRNMFNTGSDSRQDMLKSFKGGKIDINKWYGVAFSWDRGKGEGKIYINGVVVATKLTTHQDRDLFMHSDAYFYIGINSDNNDEHFHGFISNITVSKGIVPTSVMIQWAKFIDVATTTTTTTTTSTPATTTSMPATTRMRDTTTSMPVDEERKPIGTSACPVIPARLSNYILFVLVAALLTWNDTVFA